MKQIIISGNAVSGKTQLAQLISAHSYNNPATHFVLTHIGMGFRDAVRAGCDVAVFDDVHLKQIPEILHHSNEQQLDVIIVTNMPLIQAYEDMNKRDRVDADPQLNRIRAKILIACEKGYIEKARKSLELFGVIRVGKLDPRHYDEYEHYLNALLA